MNTHCSNYTNTTNMGLLAPQKVDPSGPVVPWTNKGPPPPLSILVARPCIHRPRLNFAGELLEGVWVPPGAKMAPSPPPYPSQDQGFLILDPNLVDFGRQLGDFMLQL